MHHSTKFVAGHSEEKLGGAAACAVKRTNLDVRIAKCASRTGANLMEGFEVVEGKTVFSKESGLWTVTSSAVSFKCFCILLLGRQRACLTVAWAQGKSVQGRCLIIADGATSRLATELGYCTEPPQGVCSRAFVEGGTHNTKFDGKT